MRSTTAIPFMKIRNASSTQMAAEVRETKPRSGLSAQMNICVGREVAGSMMLSGAAVMKAFIPISSRGAVSPSACASPMIVPVRMPGMASGRTCWNTT